MRRKEIIYICLTVILIIISAIIFMGGRTVSAPKKIDCEKECIQFGGNKWILVGVATNNIFSTQADCISACQSRNIKK